MSPYFTKNSPDFVNISPDFAKCSSILQKSSGYATEYFPPYFAKNSPKKNFPKNNYPGWGTQEPPDYATAYAPYNVTVVPHITSIHVSFCLFLAVTSPHAPYNVTVVPHITSVHISWQPAYDGGYAQTYTIR